MPRRQGVYSESGTSRPKFRSNKFKRLSEIEANLLEVEFEENEVWEAVKVDFEKAYACVNWEFLYEVTSQMGFERKWCGWIRACLETATSSILVNGLNIMMQEVLNTGLLEGIKIGSDETGDSKHMVWVNWEKALSSYRMGGLNIDSLKAMNWALLSKWCTDKLVYVTKGLGGGMIGHGNDVEGSLQEEGWKISDDGKFSVNIHRDLIDEKTLGSTRRQFVTPWCKSIPKKVYVFLWRLYHGRFPVCTILDDIGINKAGFDQEEDIHRVEQLLNNSSPLDVLNNHFKIFSDSNDDCTSSDDDYGEDIDFVEAPPPNSELVSLEEVKNFVTEDGEINTDILLKIKDDILHDKLLNINLLIAKIKALNDNPTPDCVLKSPSPFPILIEDSDSFFEKSNTSLSYSDNSLPEFETFSYHTKETSSGSITTHADNSLPEYDSFLLEIKPNQGELTSVIMDDIVVRQSWIIILTQREDWPRFEGSRASGCFDHRSLQSLAIIISSGRVFTNFTSI
ncbi:hypothetical protein Tco_0726970 [Tanacetum coccineum]|uniref:Reverse transcriptase zinc-binding domain-containing protein n=1 Tax=Tanacetum coccineum TaxID=301880 RepID=A0ABQ4YH29_9ASTR